MMSAPIMRQLRNALVKDKDLRLQVMSMNTCACEGGQFEDAGSQSGNILWAMRLEVC